ncbi:PD-(D/E)XK nuclease family transposase [Desulfotomaculum nigrificans]|uniref:PD-(D/E)XK nuclease family transposase n=1 Tax=Desulfotomaculum nigrificans TaxID=1565 RepID=UPI0001FAEB4A|nr:PD-(D/E)XK nuclease family transposase [Desulfotomaculum nigrificans]
MNWKFIFYFRITKSIEAKTQTKGPLEEWLLYFNNIAGEEMEAIAMGNPGIRKAMTIEQIFFKNQQERRLYELREKAARDEISMISGARAEGRAEGEAKGQREAICKYLEVRFPESSTLQAEVKRITDVVVLDKIINKIYTANSLDEAAAIVREATESRGRFS